jgi:hypothetical protein
MIAWIFAHVQWRFVLNDRPAPGLGGAELEALWFDGLRPALRRLAKREGLALALCTSNLREVPPPPAGYPWVPRGGTQGGGGGGERAGLQVADALVGCGGMDDVFAPALRTSQVRAGPPARAVAAHPRPRTRRRAKKDGVGLARKMQVGPCIPMGIQL